MIEVICPSCDSDHRDFLNTNKGCGYAGEDGARYAAARSREWAGCGQMGAVLLRTDYPAFAVTVLVTVNGCRMSSALPRPLSRQLYLSYVAQSGVVIGNH